MADQRGLTFGVQWDIDTAPLDDVEEKQQQLKEDTKETAEGFRDEYTGDRKPCHRCICKYVRRGQKHGYCSTQRYG